MVYDSSMTKRPRQIADRIEHWRKIRNISPTELARRSGVDSGTVSRLLNDKTYNPTVETLEAIAKALSVGVPDLLEEPNRPPAVDPLVDLAMQASPELSPEQRENIMAFIKFVQSQNRPRPGDGEDDPDTQASSIGL